MELSDNEFVVEKSEIIETTKEKIIKTGSALFKPFLKTPTTTIF